MIPGGMSSEARASGWFFPAPTPMGMGAGGGILFLSSSSGDKKGRTASGQERGLYPVRQPRLEAYHGGRDGVRKKMMRAMPRRSFPSPLGAESISCPRGSKIQHIVYRGRHGVSPLFFLLESFGGDTPLPFLFPAVAPALNASASSPFCKRNFAPRAPSLGRSWSGNGWGAQGGSCMSGVIGSKSVGSGRRGRGAGRAGARRERFRPPRGSGGRGGTTAAFRLLVVREILPHQRLHHGGPFVV